MTGAQFQQLNYYLSVKKKEEEEEEDQRKTYLCNKAPKPLTVSPDRRCTYAR